MGRSTRRAPGRTADQSTGVPVTKSVANAVSAVAGSSRSRRSSGTAPGTIADSTASGPISTKRCPSSGATASAKRTVVRTWDTQKSGSDQSPAERYGTVDRPNSRPRTTRSKSASIGSIRREWNAWLVRSRFVVQSRASISARSDALPETTIADGPLTAATSTYGKWVFSSCSVACTASIAPPAGNACISRPRAVTILAASARDSTPATWAAAISPTEWPTSTSGRTPQWVSRANSATSTAKIAGWAYSVVSSSSGSSRAAASGLFRCRSNSAATVANASA